MVIFKFRGKIYSEIGIVKAEEITLLTCYFLSDELFNNLYFNLQSISNL